MTRPAFTRIASRIGGGLAYQSNATGRYEMFVRGLTAGGGQWPVSNGGGEEPH